MTKAKEIAEQRSEQVRSTDQILALIADRVTHIRQLNSKMAGAADEQSSVAQNVNQSIGNISQLAERTAMDAEQTNAFIGNLVGLAKRLNQLVDRFQR